MSFDGRLRVLSVLSAAAVLLAACSPSTPEASLASARKKLASNEFHALVIEAKNALQLKPDLAEGRYLLGVGLVRTGDPAGGEAELNKALALGQPADDIAPVLAQSLLAQRQYRRVITQFAGLRPARPADRASLKTTVAAAHFLSGENDLAQAALTDALDADPTNGLALLLQAKSQAARGEVDAAIAGLSALIARAPTNAAAWKLKGDLLATAKDQALPALAAYRQAAESTPGDVGLQTDIMAMLLRLGQLDEAARQSAQLKKLAPNLPRAHFLDTLLAFDRKDFKAAQALARPLLVLAPADAANWLLAGDIELALKDFPQAQTYLGRALALAPQSVPARRLLVTSHLRSAQNAKALAALQPLLAGAEPDAAVMALAGEVYQQTGDSRQAETWFAKASRQDPANKSLRSSLALTRLAGGNGDAVLAEVRDIAASDTDVAADLALIGTYVMRQQFEPALAAIAALEKKQPGQPLAANLRGRALLARKDLAGARASFDHALSISPGYFAAIDGLAAVDLVEGKPQAARERFEALLTRAPRNVQVLLALAALRAGSGASKDEVAALMQRAVAADPTEKRSRLALIDFGLRHGDTAAARVAAQQAVAALPDSPELLDALGRVHQAGGDLNQAIASYQKLATLQPGVPLPQMRLAGAYLAMKDKPAAMASLRRALAIQPDLLDAQRALIPLALEANDDDEAVRLARKVQQQRPKDTAGYLFEAEVATRRQQWGKAFAAYQRGLAQTPSPDLARRAHAALGAAGQAAEAGKFATGWLASHPDDAVFRLYLGDVHAARNDYPAAEKLYASVIRLQPGNAAAYNNLAWVSGRLKRNGATTLAEKAVALAPDQPAFMDTLAQLLARDRQYAKALAWQARVLALQPQNGAFRLTLARIQIMDGKKDLARNELNTLASLGDKFRGQAEVARLLKSL